VADLKINFVDFLPKDIDPTEPTEVDEAERARLVKVFQRVMAEHKEHPLVASVEAGDATFHMELFRHGQSSAAVWSVEDDNGGWRVVAVSAFLLGRNGAEDISSIDALRKREPQLPLSAKDFNRMIAAERPCIQVHYLDGDWYRNGKVALVAGACALAGAAGPDNSPRMEMERPLTEEAKAELDRRAAKVFKAFQVIQHESMRTGRVRYVCRAQEKVMGRPIGELKDVKFWVGIDGKGGELLDLDETVAVFELYRDQFQQLQGAKHLKKLEFKGTLSLRHDPAVIATVLGSVQIDEPKD
jgi:hypothetical protein